MINQIGANMVSSQPRMSESHFRNEIPKGMEQPTNQTKEENQDKVKVKQKDIKEVVQGLNDFIQPTNTSLKFEYHEKLDEYFVKLIDENTHEVIREIPSKKVLDMYAAMKEFLGLMVDKKI